MPVIKEEVKKPLPKATGLKFGAKKGLAGGASNATRA